MDGVHDVDALMGYLGDFGKYQCWQFFLHILSALTAGLHMLSLVTVAAVPDHRCDIPEIDINHTMADLNETILSIYLPQLPNGKFDSCSYINTTNETIHCNSWVYNTTYYQSSRAIEWNFVCDDRWKGAVAQSMYMFGVFTGAITLGNMADKYGRKIVFYWSAVLQLILGVAVAFTPEYFSFIILRYLYGIFGSAGSYIPAFVLTMELVGPSKRSMCGVAFQAAFACGIMLVAGWGALIKDRQLLQVVYGLHGLLLVGHWWLMDESPRWLWANGRIREAIEIIKKALKMNNSPITIDTTEFVSSNKIDKRKETDGNSANLGDLFKTPNLRKKTLNICFAWFANSLAYYGLSLSSGSMSGNPFLILFIMGLVELPSYVLTVYFMDRLGRRSLMANNMIIGGICCISAALLTTGSIESTILVFLGKFLIASSFAIVYNYSAELFPTVLRNSAIGLGAMCARASGALTPLLLLFDSLDPTLPSIIFAVLAILSGLGTLWLPETLNKPMPQTLEDGEMFGIGDTCFTACLGGKEYSPTATSDNETVKNTMNEQTEPLKS